jgi:hypothetical protein
MDVPALSKFNNQNETPTNYNEYSIEQWTKDDLNELYSDLNLNQRNRDDYNSYFD